MPCALHIDKYPDEKKKFRELMSKPENTEAESDIMSDMRLATWDSFDNPNESSEPDWSMVSQYLLEELDDLNGKWLKDDGRLMFVNTNTDSDEYWDEYWDEVKALLNKYVVKVHQGIHTRTVAQADGTKKAVEDEGFQDEWEIVKNIVPKLRWYKNEAGIANMPRLRIPMLTPKMLDALAANISRTADAFQEVSVVIMFLLTNAFNQWLNALVLSLLSLNHCALTIARLNNG